MAKYKKILPETCIQSALDYGYEVKSYVVFTNSNGSIFYCRNTSVDSVEVVITKNGLAYITPTFH